ncbi:MAG TPA: hypothetical protein VFZ48_01105 [Candidatus Saccharimonadales bacterium]
MSTLISLKGLDKSKVFAVLFLNSLCYTAEPPHTEDLLRAMYFNSNSYLDPTPYDEAHYKGYAAEVITHYRKTGKVARYCLETTKTS